MRYLKYLVLLSALMVLPAAYSQAQVSVGVQVGPVYGAYNAPPVCEYGFYPDYPYGCAPYGYYGPDYFVNGVFIGVGPWANFYYSHAAFYRPYYFNRGFGVSGGFHSFNGAGYRTFGSERAYRDDYRGYRGGDSYRGNGYRGGESYLAAARMAMAGTITTAHIAAATGIAAVDRITAARMADLLITAVDRTTVEADHPITAVDRTMVVPTAVVANLTPVVDRITAEAGHLITVADRTMVVPTVAVANLTPVVDRITAAEADHTIAVARMADVAKQR